MAGTSDEQQERRILELIDQYWPPLMPLAAALVDDAVACGMLVAPRGPTSLGVVDR